MIQITKSNGLFSKRYHDKAASADIEGWKYVIKIPHALIKQWDLNNV